MTYAHCWYTCRHTVAAAALALMVAGLVGCAAGAASRPREAILQSMAPVTSAAPEHACAAFACEL